MCEKTNVKKTKRFRDNRMLTKSETFIYSRRGECPKGGEMSSISLVLRQSLPPLTDRPNATKLEIE